MAKAAHRGSYIEMLLFSMASLIASFVLSVDAVILAANPNADLSCNINSKISCGTVGQSWQASVFGFPNSFLGLIFEPMVITVCVAALGKVVFPRWFMVTAQAIYAIAFAFAWWLFYQAYFVIGALCPWCLLVTVATTMVFATMTRINLLNNAFGFSATTQAKTERALRLGVDYGILAIFMAVFAAAVILRYF